MGISKKNMSILVMAFVTVFLDMMNYALIVPILPYLVKEFDSTSLQEGILFSSYSVFQLISLLIMGPLSDKYGRKPFLLLSLFGSCFGSIFQAMSMTMWTFIIWRSFTGLFAGSLILVQAVVADVTDTSIRNTWLSRLDGVVSAAFIVGPAIGAVLMKVNNRFPLYFAGVVSGIAMIVACIFLKESHPRVLNKKAGDASSTQEEDKKKEETPKVKAKVTFLMALCFIFEFCVRWTGNAFDSRYGFFLTDKFNTTSDHYSLLVILSSVICCIFQTFIYPWLVSKVGIPIPYLATIGMAIEIFSYIGMSAINNELGSMIASLILWIGFCCASPASVSIISTTTSPEIQGTVLSWNNFCYQGSLIVCPLVLSSIYTWNIDATYYFSSIFAVIGTVVMGYLSTWKNAKTLGKPSQPTEIPEPKVDIEMKPMEGEVSNEHSSELEKKEEVLEVAVKPTETVPAVVSVTVDEPTNDKVVAPWYVCFLH